MKRSTVIGLILIMLISFTLLGVIEEIPGLLQAFLTGIIIGSTIALMKQFKNS